MLCLGKSFGLNHIEVLIQIRSVEMGGNYGVVECTEDGGNDQDDIQNIGRDDQRDLLPTYCPNTGKMFLSAQWAYEITHVGQCFDGGPNEFCEVLCKYAVERGFQFKYIKNDSVRIIAVYKFVEAIGCKWSVHVRMLPSRGVLALRGSITCTLVALLYALTGTYVRGLIWCLTLLQIGCVINL